jgi:predicted aminopeptidase
VAWIKKFGESNGLKPTSNYTNYVKLDRTAAVWVVSACEKLKFQPKQWDFPIVGSFPYLGFFDRNDAMNYAQELKKDGWDVDFRGASAYSTLGWFKDPILSTMLSTISTQDPATDTALGDLANIVIHESVHATLYLQGQSYFNESLASFVADQLTFTYLSERRGKASVELKAYQTEELKRRELDQQLREAYQYLMTLYGSHEPDDEKLIKKTAFLQNLQKKLEFRREINNATLVQYKTYNTGEEKFQELLTACHTQWPAFMSCLKRLTPNSMTQPQQQDFREVLTPLIESHCCETLT